MEDIYRHKILNINMDEFFSVRSSLKVDQQIIKEVDNDDSQYNDTYEDDTERSLPSAAVQFKPLRENLPIQLERTSKEDRCSDLEGSLGHRAIIDVLKGTEPKLASNPKLEIGTSPDAFKIEELDSDTSNSKRNSPTGLNGSMNISVDRYGVRLVDKKPPLKRDKSHKGIENCPNEAVSSQKPHSRGTTNASSDACKKKKDSSGLNGQKETSSASNFNSTTTTSNPNSNHLSLNAITNTKKSFKEKNSIEITSSVKEDYASHPLPSLDEKKETLQLKQSDPESASKKERSVSEKLKKYDSKNSELSSKDLQTEPLRKKKPAFQSEPPKKSAKPATKAEKTPDSSFLNTQKQTSTSKPPDRSAP